MYARGKEDSVVNNPEYLRMADTYTDWCIPTLCNSFGIPTHTHSMYIRTYVGTYVCMYHGCKLVMQVIWAYRMYVCSYYGVSIQSHTLLWIIHTYIQCTCTLSPSPHAYTFCAYAMDTKTVGPSDHLYNVIICYSISSRTQTLPHCHADTAHKRFPQLSYTHTPLQLQSL